VLINKSARREHYARQKQSNLGRLPNIYALIFLKRYVFEEVDTRGGYHNEMKTRLFLVDYHVYFSLLGHTDKQQGFILSV